MRNRTNSQSASSIPNNKALTGYSKVQTAPNMSKHTTIYQACDRFYSSGGTQAVCNLILISLHFLSPSLSPFLHPSPSLRPSFHSMYVSVSHTRQCLDRSNYRHGLSVLLLPDD